MKKTLIVKAFQRPALLESCLVSLANCDGLEAYHVVLVHQRGNEQVAQIIRDNSFMFQTVIQTEALGSSTDSNITRNTMLGYSVAFDYLESSFAVAIEDDVVLAPDTLNFVDAMYSRFHDQKKFRGVNLGSRIPFSEGLEDTFSLLRFGLHGPASMITLRTWKRLRTKRILNHHRFIFDAQFEFQLKSGFMVTPNLSRFINLGTDGSHSQIDLSVDEYFQDLQKSFVGRSTHNSRTYQLLSISHERTRKDCIIYNPYDNWKFFLYEVAYGYWLRKLDKSHKEVDLKTGPSGG